MQKHIRFTDNMFVLHTREDREVESADDDAGSSRSGTMGCTWKFRDGRCDVRDAESPVDSHEGRPKSSRCLFGMKKEEMKRVKVGMEHWTNPLLGAAASGRGA
jgi:hypothetical protein